jgi:hypothetical protein
MSEYICPHCKQLINDDQALLCLYCGQSLNRTIGFMGKLRYPVQKKVIVVIVALVLVSFLILMIR